MKEILDIAFALLQWGNQTVLRPVFGTNEESGTYGVLAMGVAFLLALVLCGRAPPNLRAVFAGHRVISMVALAALLAAVGFHVSMHWREDPLGPTRLIAELIAYSVLSAFLGGAVGYFLCVLFARGPKKP